MTDEWLDAVLESFCWDALAKFTAKYPLCEWQEAEVLARHPSIVRANDEKRER